MPNTGTCMVWKRRIALVAMVSAASCAVVTITTPESGTSCASESGASPVAGRQIHHQIIQPVPLYVAQQLLHRPRHHRTAPDHRLPFLEQQAD